VIGAIGVVLVAAIAEMIFPQKLKAVNALQPSLSSLED
jgi:solute:Na+ symporter, SSS family